MLRGREGHSVAVMAIWGILFSAAALGQTPTSTTLLTSPNPANLGQPVTLTATVTAGATGNVTFYDGTTVLGISPISGIQATLTTVLLPSGARSLHAHYAGDGAYAASDSVALPQSVVAVASLGFKAPVNYGAPGAPTYVAVGDFNGDSKQDLAVINNTGATVQIFLGNGDGSFQSALSYAVGAPASMVVVADFNADGKADLVMGINGGTAVKIALGNGDGTFQAAASVAAIQNPSTVAVGDFNGDGKADVAVGSFWVNSVGVLIGNGDGTFQSVVSYAAPSAPYALVVGDFNGDSRADLAAACPGLGYLALFKGNGDGTFQAAQNFNGGGAPAFLVAGDLNGDGKLDVVLANNGYQGELSVLLGNGDGTFQVAATSFISSPYASSMMLGDFNGDGKVDLALPEEYSPGLLILLGNGDGSFQVNAAIATSTYTYGLVTGEFNGDGRADLAIASGANVSVLLGGAIPDLTIAMTHGNGFAQGQQGAFYKLTISNAGDIATTGSVGVFAALPAGFTAISIAGSGWTCVLSTLTCIRSDALAAGTAYPPILVTVNIASNLTGNVTANATVSGGSDGNTGNNLASDTTFVRFLTTTSLTSSPNPSLLGQSVTLTATISSGTGKVTFYDGLTVLGVANLVGSQAVLSTSLLTSGSHSLTARFDGDTTFGPGLSSTHIQTVNVLSTNGMKPAGSYPFGPYVATGDFNHDGKADLVSSAGTVLMGNGDGTFQANAGYVVPTGASGPVIAGDFNGDGNLDFALVSSNYQNSSVFVFLGNGDGSFQTSIVASANSYVSEAIATDIDQDGRLDLIGIVNGGLGVLLGNGDGTFQAPLSMVTSGVQSGFWAVADFNRDGKQDVVLTNGAYGPSMSIFLGNGDGTFQPPQSYPGINTYAMGLSTGDFNGDGKADILFTYWVGAAVLLGNGDGTFQAAVYSTFTYASSPPWNITLPGDFNGDGKLDFAYRGYYGGSVQFLFGNGDGTFQSPSPSVPTDGYGGNMVSADFNGDGRPDLAVANQYTATTVNVFLGGLFSGLGINLSHSGRLTAGQTKTYQIVVNEPAFAATAGTVTVTGVLPPGLTATDLSGLNWTCTVGTLTCTRNDPLNGGFSYSPISFTVQAAASLSPSTLVVGATVNWNGVVNSASDPTAIVLATTTSLTASPNPVSLGQAVTLTATVSSGGGEVTFYNGGAVLGAAVLSGNQASLSTRLLPSGAQKLYATYAGDATHGPSSSSTVAVPVNAAQSSGFVSGASPATGAGPWDIVMGDLNGDGKADLVTPNSTAKTVSVFLGNGDGTFQPKADYTVGTQPVAVAIGNFNGDRKPDLAVANQNSSSLSILLNNGDGTFSPAVSVSTGNATSPVSVVASDFDGDGKIDLLVGMNGGSAYLLLGNGDGTFHPSSNTTYLCCNAPVAVGDFNGDRKPDLSVGGNVYAGNGDGTFQSGNSLGYFGTAVAVGDLNRDGKADVIETDDSSGIYVVLGNGDATFQALTHYNGGSQPIGIAIADVNGDGKLDAIAANSGSGNATIWFGAGDGTFPSSANYSAGTTPRGVVAGDFNGDGRTDLAISNYGSNNITILLGVLPPVLNVSSAHGNGFYLGQTGGVFTITASNGGPGVTSGTVTVTDTLPSGFTATALSGTGWSCVLGTLTCTRSDTLGVGASYPAITLTVNVAANAPPAGINQVNLSGGGSPAAYAADGVAIVSSPTAPALTSPANLATGVALRPSLSWTAATGAVSYDVYFGTSSTPPLLTNVTFPTYSPAALNLGTTYYWKIVANNPNGSTSSATWSFTTILAGAPAASGSSPASGSGLTHTFTFTFNDPSGWQDLSVVNVLVNRYLDGIGACYVAFAPASATSGYLYLVDDAGDGGYANGSPIALPSSGTLQNSQCAISGAGSSVVSSGNTLTLTLAVTFKSAFAGNQVFYLAARSNSQNSGWQAMGTWTVPGPPPTGPAVGAVNPARSSTLSQTYTFTYTDTNGFADLAVVNVLVNNFLDGIGACYVAFAPTSATSGYLYLVDDAGDGGYANGSPIALSSSGSLQNSQCTINAAGSSVLATGNLLTLNLAITFNQGFAGNQVFYLAARNNTTGNSGWQAVGSVTVP